MPTWERITELGVMVLLSGIRKLLQFNCNREERNARFHMGISRTGPLGGGSQSWEPWYCLADSDMLLQFDCNREEQNDRFYRGISRAGPLGSGSQSWEPWYC